MGKQDYLWRNIVPFGQLPKEERKAIGKVMTAKREAKISAVRTCATEMRAMLTCLEAHDDDSDACRPQIDTYETCADGHDADPDPRVPAKAWQKAVQRRVQRYFSDKHVAGRWQ